MTSDIKIPQIFLSKTEDGDNVVREETLRIIPGSLRSDILKHCRSGEGVWHVSDDMMPYGYNFKYQYPWD